MYKDAYLCIIDYAKVVDNVHQGTVITYATLTEPILADTN